MLHSLKLNSAAGRGERALRHQRGLSMVELSLVLIVVAVLLAAVYWGFSQAQRRIEVKENIEAIQEIVGATQARFIRTKNLRALQPEVAVRSGVIPARLRVPGTNTAMNSYGGSVGLWHQAGGCFIGDVGCDLHSYAVLYWEKVPREQCVDLVLGAWHSMHRISVIGQSVVKHHTYGGVNGSLLATSCNANPTATLSFEFGEGIGKGRGL